MTELIIIRRLVRPDVGEVAKIGRDSGGVFLAVADLPWLPDYTRAQTIRGAYSELLALYNDLLQLSDLWHLTEFGDWTNGSMAYVSLPPAEVRE